MLLSPEEAAVQMARLMDGNVSMVASLDLHGTTVGHRGKMFSPVTEFTVFTSEHGAIRDTESWKKAFVAPPSRTEEVKFSDEDPPCLYRRSTTAAHLSASSAWALHQVFRALLSATYVSFKDICTPQLSLGFCCCIGGVTGNFVAATEFPRKHCRLPEPSNNIP